MADKKTPPLSSQRASDVWPVPRPGEARAEKMAEEPADLSERALLMALLVEQLLSRYVVPPGAQAFTLQGEVDHGAATLVVLPNSLQVPEGYEAVITFVQFLSTVCDATSAGQAFTLRVSGAGVPGFDGIQVFQGGGAQSTALEVHEVEVAEGQSIDVTHLGVASARHVGYMVRGYLAPKGERRGK